MRCIDPSISRHKLGNTCNNSTHHHYGSGLLHRRTHQLDRLIGDALRIITGCLKPTLTEYFPVPSGIPPAELRRKAATLSLASRSSDPSHHTLYNYIHRPTTSGHQSRNPFVIEAQDLLAHIINTSMWIQNTWKEKWTKDILYFHSFVTDVGPAPNGQEDNGSAWVWLNGLCTGIERFGFLMFKRGLPTTAA